MRLEGAGAPGTIGADGRRPVRAADDGTTTIAYDADAVVGGMVGGVGQRMLTSVSRRMAGEFFGNVDAVLTGAAPDRRRSPPAAGCRERAAAVFTAPRPAAGGRRRSATSSRASPSAPALVVARRRCSGGAGDAVTGDRPSSPPARAQAEAGTPARHLRPRAARPPPGPDRASATRELNAIVSLDEERARAGAAAADEHLARGGRIGPLHGLPFAVKDTHAVAGWRTTYGSPLFADHVPDTDDLVVERIRRAGAVLIGKTNVPEFAAGSHTFNTVFGTTRNPLDPTRSAGGSSGGAACALAAGMVPLADGSDMGGSLRNPASFCGVVGLRPVARPGADLARGQPVGDDVGRRPDGPHRRRPRAAAVGDRRAGPAGPARARRPRRARSRRRSRGSLAGLRVGCSVDLGGAFAVDPPRSRRCSRRPAGCWSAPRGVGLRRPPRPRRQATTPSARCAPGTSRRRSATCCAGTPTTSSSRSPTTSGRGSGSPAPTWPAPTQQRTALGRDDARVLRRVRRAGAAGLAGAAVPGRPGVPDRDQRPADGRPTSTGCARRTSSPSPAARRSRSRPAAHPRGCRSASSWSRPTARTGGCSRSRRRSRPRAAGDVSTAWSRFWGQPGLASGDNARRRLWRTRRNPKYLKKVRETPCGAGIRST